MTSQPDSTHLERLLCEHLLEMLEEQSHRIDAQEEEIRQLRSEMADLVAWKTRMAKLFEMAVSQPPDSSPG